MGCFEGMKAYAGMEDGLGRLFRPELNMARLQRSQQRLMLADFDAKVGRLPWPHVLPTARLSSTCHLGCHTCVADATLKHSDNHAKHHGVFVLHSSSLLLSTAAQVNWQANCSADYGVKISVAKRASECCSVGC